MARPENMARSKKATDLWLKTQHLDRLNPKKWTKRKLAAKFNVHESLIGRAISRELARRNLA